MSDSDTILARIEQKLDDALTIQHEHHATLYSQGTGLAYLVPRIEQTQRDCLKRQEASAAATDGQTNRRPSWWGVWVAVGTALLTAVLQAWSMTSAPTKASIDTMIAEHFKAASAAARVASPGDPQAQERWKAAGRAGERPAVGPAVVPSAP